MKMGMMTVGLAVVLLAAGGAMADVFDMGEGLTNLEFLTVGNPGNGGVLSGSGAYYYGAGDPRICGAVNYVYKMGKYEITAAQYTEFLNAVAKTDRYGLYSVNMDHNINIYGCNIIRSGTPENYTYTVAADWANRPVGNVSWGDAVRYANWLTNGQPVGEQDASTTEDGSYFINGAITNEALVAVTRKANPRYVVPSEDEWYKAAYHKNDGVTNNYWICATGTDTMPSNTIAEPDPGNNGNFYGQDLTIGSPYWRTEVGEYENSQSPYGTYDQCGNVNEWTEALMYTSNYRQRRGGTYYQIGTDALAGNRGDSMYGIRSADEFGSLGFRIAEVPEPATIGLLTLGGLALMRRRRGRA